MTAQRDNRLVRIFDQPDLALVSLVAMAALVATTLGIAPVLRMVVAVPLVLLLPGYSVLSAVFPSRVLPAVERLLLSIGLSIGITVLLGLGIAATGVPLAPLSWAVALAVITLVACGVAWFRRVRRGLVGPGANIARMPRTGVAMVIVAALIAADVLLGSRLIAAQQQVPQPVQLWLVPVSGRPNDALLGVRAGATPAEFRIVISSSGQTISEFDVALDAAEAWEQNVNFSPDLRARPIVARLYEGTSEVESRFVVLQPQTNVAT